jgi:hypothetical protein
MIRVRVVVAAILWVQGVTWLLSGYLHTGRHFSFLPLAIRDPNIRGAPEVEWIGGLLLLAAAVAVTLGLRGAWRLSVTATGYAIAADVVGMVLIAAGRGAESNFNFWFHRIGIVVSVLILGLLLTRGGRRALGKMVSLPPREAPTGT